MTRRFNLILLALALVIGGPYYWLLLDNSPRSLPPHALDMAKLRQLASAIPGERPKRVEVELLGWRRLPGDLFAAGSGLKRRMIAVTSFRLPVEGSGPVVIDTGYSPQIAETLEMERFVATAQARVDASLKTASLILATDEHPDHLGGLATLAGQPEGAAVLAHARLRPQQLIPATGSSGLSLNATLQSSRPEAVAPGVVAIPAPGHTPGSQMIFVRLTNGSEYLFTGDVSPLALNWKEQRSRSRLLTDYYAPEDRPTDIRWLRTIRELKQQAPALHIIPGHDFEWLVDPLNHSGVIHFDHDRHLPKAAGS
jgi:glyoxylase-like metal-dependent hydrolase (beta-lactamase superfamily II)